MAQPIKKVYLLGIARSLPSIAINFDTLNDIVPLDINMSVGTNALGGATEVLFKIDLSGIPNDIIISSAILNLEVITPAGAGFDDDLRYEVMPICAGLDIDFKSCTYNSYDGINPWPLKRYDNSVRLTGLFSTATGSWDITDLKPIIDFALAHGENELVIVIKRVKKIAPHKQVTFSSDSEGDDTKKPTLTITHSIPTEPQTVIRKGRLTLIKPNNHRTRPKIPYGQYDLAGKILTISEDGRMSLKEVGGNVQILVDRSAQMLIVDGGIDGGGVKRLTNWRGMRDRWQFTWPSGNTQTNRRLYVVATTYSGVLGGLFIPDRPGSIVGLSCWCDINIIGTGGTVRMESRINDTIKLVANLTASVADGLVFSITASLGVYTFVAGDKISGNRLLTDGGAGQITTDDMGMIITMEYD